MVKADSSSDKEVIMETFLYRLIKEMNFLMIVLVSTGLFKS